MRAPLLMVLWVSGSAVAATFTGRVMHEGVPVNGASVTILSARQGSLLGCPANPRGDFLGKCLCPSEREAFTTRALAGLPSTPNVITNAVTGTDGAFSISADGAGPFIARVSSADGALLATVKLGAEAKDIELAPAVIVRIQISGATDVAAYLIESGTGEIDRMERRDGEWVSGPLSPGLRNLVIVAPGTTPVRQMLNNGRLMGRMGGGVNAIPTMELRPPQLIRGVVTDKGRPVKGADVVADPETCAITTKSNSQGEFSLPSLTSPAFVTTVTARAGSKFVSAYASSERITELALKPSAKLELTFVDAAGKPAPGVELWVLGQDGSNLSTPPSDAKGRWSMGNLTEGSVSLRVGRPWVLLSPPTIALKGVTKSRAVVAAGVTLSGRVIDGKGKPIAAAALTLKYGEKLKATEDMKVELRGVGDRSNASGTFEIPGVLPGEYELVAEHAAFGETSLVITAPDKVEVTLSSPFVLEGDVVDQAGKPVGKASVTWIKKGDPNHSFGTSTGADGHFRYALKENSTYEVTASRGFGAAKSKPVLVEIPSEGLKLVVPEPQAIRGVVLDSDGKPLAGVVVQAIAMSMPQLVMARMQRQMPLPDPAPLVAQARMMNSYLETTSAKDGTFTLPMEAETMIFAAVGDQLADPVKGSTKAPVELKVTPHAHATGRVLDPSGRPLEAFSINGRPFNSTQGRFDLPLPAKGTLDLRIDATFAAWETRKVEVPGPATDVAVGDITLKRGFTITGKVIAADTRKPPASPRVDAKSEAGQFDHNGTQADGTFTLRRVPAGKLTLTGIADDYAPEEMTIDVKASSEVLVTLQKDTSLEISVLLNKEPTAGIRVELSGPPLPTAPVNRRFGTTASNGRVKFDKLGPGEWTIASTGTSRTVKLKAGQLMKLELSLPAPSGD